MTDPTPNSENSATYSLSPPTEQKVTTESDSLACSEIVAGSLTPQADILLQGDMTPAKEGIDELDSPRRIQDTDDGEDHLKDPGSTQAKFTTKDAWFEIIEFLESSRLVELPTQLLVEGRKLPQPRLHDIRGDDKRSSITVHVRMARGLTFGELAKVEHTIRVGNLCTVYTMMDCMRQAAELAPNSDPGKPGYLNNLGIAYDTLFNRLGKLEHGRRAVDCLALSVALTPDDDPKKSSRLSNIGVMYQRLFDRRGELQHINMAVDCGTQAVGLASDKHPDKPVYLNNLGGAYQKLFKRLGELQHIHIAVSYGEQAVALTPSNHPDRASHLSSLGSAYQTLCDRLGELQHIYMAVDYKAQAVALTPDGHPDKPGLLNNLGIAYETLFYRLGELQHIYLAIDCKTQAAALTSDCDPDKRACLNNLGNSYEALFNRLGELQHIHMAVDYKAQAVVLTPDGHPDKPGCLNSLGRAYETLFNRIGELQYIHMAIDCNTQAVALTPDNHPDKPARLSTLGSAYTTLFNQLGELQHIHMAVDYQAQAVALALDNHPDKPSYLNNLGNAYGALFKRLGDLRHIHMAIDCKTQAVGLTPNGHPGKPGLLDNLGSAYGALFKCLGKLQHINMAIDCGTQAVALTPDGHPDKPNYLNNLGSTYEILFNQIGERQHIHAAVDCRVQAVTLTPKGDPLGAYRLAGLGQSYFFLFSASYELEHIVKSELYSKSAALSPTGYPMHRLQGATLWARLSRIGQSNVLEAYNSCMLRLPEAVWLGTSVRRRFERLASDVRDLVSDAAAAALLANRCDLAVEWLEQGRCLVWGQMLQLRTPFEKLRGSHPELADELYTLSSQLEDTGSFTRICQTASMHEGLSQNGAYTHSRLADMRDRLINEIRLKPGFDDFLRPPKVSTIISHVQHGAAVILTVHESQCDAIIIKPGARAIDHVPLPAFSDQKTKELCQQLVLCLKSQGIARGVKRGDGSLQVSFKNILASLWLDVVKPVLDHLNITRVLLIDDLPHITWCIAGALSFLPIHAAGIYDSPSTILSNLAISSYTPTISSMGRSHSTPPTFSGVLAVGHQSSIRGLSPLPGTKDELDRVEERFVNRQLTRLEEDAATVDAVVKAMADHSWVHFACHGSQDPLDPMNSSLHLHDKPLSLAMISRHSMKNAQLAFLSACQTAKGDSELPNEAVHLAAGLLMAGYANVIATLWSIKDQDAPIVAGETYKCLLESGVPDSRKAAKALHRAVKHLRDTIGVNEFARWVPYIHMGG
ncbi:hypothetical protein FRC09_010535 [Ceratobasidium sp. 395]|nr:hypothetical protein FRC09_010535 [Ceratobasidium sp. 395]